MKRSTRALATGAAIAARPRGLRRLFGALLILVLVLVLGLTFLALVGKRAGRSDDPLPCTPETTAVKFTPDNTPTSVQETVAEAVKASGRSVELTDYGEGVRPDLVVSWWPTSEDNPPNFQGRTLRLEVEPTIKEVTAALDEKLASCEGDETATGEKSSSDHPSPKVSGQRVTWSSPVTWIGAAVIVWWLGGPWLVRMTGRGIRRARSRRAPRDEPQTGGAPKTEGVLR
ncbi:hypothetical protein [Brevibacterium aurantiacum]|uniref:Uncharacterized protein n=1 Tax=Brevibacterium aurantiacum TaxID=273384 RepID=A0A2H1JG98_BREAU|nr:hypothetical protein [Brevibacterium aurantiacum]SMX86192.1 hypothetical protein BAURA86_01643 [Brevibacterium aurantiacum]